MEYEENQLHREFLSVVGLNPWAGNNSASRTQMFGSHIGQRLVIEGASERRCMTGMEMEFGKYTLNVEMPEDGQIIKVIERYPYTPDASCIESNPQTVVIYENTDGVIGMINLPNYCSYHPYFGFEYKAQPGLETIKPRAFIPKGTVFLDTPSKTKDGGYMYGAEVNVAYMSHPAASEDGILISRDILNKFNIRTYETRVVEWGVKRIPLNMYGTPEKFKGFPDIGECVREDGLLMMFRTHDKATAAVDQSIYDLMEPDYVFDKAVYANGEGGRVVDIRVIHTDPGQAGSLSGMDEQINKYSLATRNFHRKIVDEYRRLQRERGDSLVITSEFQRMVVESLAIIDDNESRLSIIYRQSPLDEYRVEFVIEYVLTPDIGFKLTDTAGGDNHIRVINYRFSL